MGKEKNKKSLAKRIAAMMLIILLPVLSLGIGFFGIQFLMNQSKPDETIEQVTARSSKTLLEKKPKEDNEPVTAEPTKPNEEVVDAKIEDRYTYQMPSVTIYNIQVGSYSESANANKMVVKINDLGYVGYVHKTDKYKVFIMSFFDRKHAEVNQVIAEQVFSGAYIVEVVLQPKKIEYSESDKNYIHTLKQDMDTIVELLSSFTRYVHDFDLTSFDQDDFSVYLITQHNEITKLKEKIMSHEVSDDLKEQQAKLIGYLERLEKQFEYLTNLEKPLQKDIWNQMIEIIFGYADLV